MSISHRAHCRFILSVILIAFPLYSCGEYTEYIETSKPVEKKETPIPPEYQEEVAALSARIKTYHAGTLPHISAEHAKIHERLGIIYFKIGDMENAHDNLERSINMDRTNPGAHLYMGRLMSKKGRLDRAVDEIEAALSLDPGLTEARRDLAEAYRGLGMIERAEESERTLEESHASGTVP